MGRSSSALSEMLFARHAQRDMVTDVKVPEEGKAKADVRDAASSGYQEAGSVGPLGGFLSAASAILAGSEPV